MGSTRGVGVGLVEAVPRLQQRVVRREVVEMRELQQHNLSGCSLSDKVEEARRQLRDAQVRSRQPEPLVTCS